LTRRGRRYRRGYPLAVLVGLEERRAVLWRVFSEVVKLDGTVERGGELYDFHESIVNALRPAFKEGIRSIVVVAPARTDYARSFLDHVRKHHTWLVRGGPNVATFGELIGAAGQLHEVHELVRTKAFRQMIGETTSRDADNIAAVLEKGLSSEDSGTVVSYSLEQIEDLVYGQERHDNLRPEHIVLTDKYLADAKSRTRILRLLQISKNNGIKTTVVSGETRAGVRLGQLGGLVCFAKRKEETMRNSTRAT
jgi:stalled ribosome rescue protein Dom34